MYHNFATITATYLLVLGLVACQNTANTNNASTTTTTPSVNTTNNPADNNANNNNNANTPAPADGQFEIDLAEAAKTICSCEGTKNYFKALKAAAKAKTEKEVSDAENLAQSFSMPFQQCVLPVDKALLDKYPRIKDNPDAINQALEKNCPDIMPDILKK
jgi:hypothetical protein